MRRIFWIIVIVVGVIFGVAWYVNRAKTHAVDGRDVVVRQSARGDAPEPEQTPQTEQPQEPAATPAPTSTATKSGQQTTSDDLTPPTTDSIIRTPPNGMIFAGRGKYQLYRQGDITWRLNTDTGQACILFATDAEWQKPRVFQHGCGTN